MALIVNDLHLGVRRMGGTTPASREALRRWMLSEVEGLICGADTDVIVLGDLFDTFEVDNRDWAETLDIFTKFLCKGHKLILVAGNHDWSPRGEKLSSFHLLTKVLTSIYANQVVEVSGSPVEIYPEVWCVPHAANQDVFDMWLGGLPNYKALLLHANCMNVFAQDSHTSLNVSEDFLLNRPKGSLVIFAHEHQYREPMDGVIVIGNSVPSSISDLTGCCSKYALEVDFGQ